MKLDMSSPNVRGLLLKAFARLAFHKPKLAATYWEMLCQLLPVINLDKVREAWDAEIGSGPPIDEAGIYLVAAYEASYDG